MVIGSGLKENRQGRLKAGLQVGVALSNMGPCTQVR